VYGFKPEAFGLTEAQAADIALIFARYDTNDDGRLDLGELRRLCDALDGEACPLDEGEWRAALQLMDTNRDGVVEFQEFVAYYVRGAKGAK